jgi:Protein of unknown function (DUF4013)
MSFPDANNPYASPTAVVVSQPAVGPFKPIDHIEHMRMFHYVFENPNWLMNILLSGLCMLIPIIGGLIVLGYQFEAVAMLLSTQGTRYPDFTFNRFAEYLVRGLWPFLVQLVASIVIVPVLLVAIFVPLLLISVVASAAGDNAEGFVALVGMLMLGLFVFLVTVLLSMMLLPLLLRAGVTQDFAEGFNIGWAIDFVKRTYKEMFLALLFLMVAGGVLSILGMLACYIGLFFVMPIVFLAQAHLYYQLYLLFLSRGGAPMPGVAHA